MDGLNIIAKEIKEMQGRLSFYGYKVGVSQNGWERMYYENLIYQETFKFEKLLKKAYKTVKDDSNNNPVQEFTLEELAYFDGSNGKPAYVAIKGFVYDVSLNATWGGGSHFGLIAGKDLTAQFLGCHPREEVLRVLPKVGVVK
ncbi:Predicted heme/steroid binding protein [Desulfonispora thiosulfatigenes DSM 11270]|uniref:Predicted heme/steroid binding protein n=1 Tax=Desulfonispora thiosulfatigenes DSM 11270 TaxID=656914 RepID=A0A1W1VBB0_DESTI|nr:cytochrome b5 domain-containing protein [Desulfonispora thiosulfatigenes]SMB90513.1 Predicted heme/steroid binding protein [Desulfonispora thiosulfatigenes DSM 11270]